MMKGLFSKRPRIKFNQEPIILNPPSKKIENLVGPVNRDDRMSWENQSITNEVKGIWHKAFFLTSTKEKEAMVE